MVHVPHTRTLTIGTLLVLAVMSLPTYAMDTHCIPLNKQSSNVQYHPYKPAKKPSSCSKLNINHLLAANTTPTKLSFLPLSEEELQRRACNIHTVLTAVPTQKQNELPGKIKCKALNILNALANKPLNSSEFEGHCQKLAQAYYRITQPRKHSGKGHYFKSTVNVWNTAMSDTSPLHPYMSLCLMLMLEKIYFADEHNTHALMATVQENHLKVLRLFSFTQTPFTHLRDNNNKTVMNYASTCSAEGFIKEQMEKEKPTHDTFEQNVYDIKQK